MAAYPVTRVDEVNSMISGFTEKRTRVIGVSGGWRTKSRLGVSGGGSGAGPVGLSVESNWHHLRCFMVERDQEGCLQVGDEKGDKEGAGRVQGHLGAGQWL